MAGANFTWAVQEDLPEEETLGLVPQWHARTSSKI